MVEVPIGTVVAYAGVLPANETGKLMEVKPGWLLCNGAAVSSQKFVDLHTAIQASHGNGSEDPDPATDFNLPDLRGLFLRGVNGARTGPLTDPNHSDTDRPQNHPGGSVGNRVGSVQADATRKPNKDFETDNPGDHQHDAPTYAGSAGNYEVGGGQSNYDYIQAAPTRGGGAHTHKISSGGDAETRPKNAYVWYIIRAK